MSSRTVQRGQRGKEEKTSEQLNYEKTSGVQWLASVVAAPGRQKQEDGHELRSILHHIVSSNSTLAQQSETLSRKKIDMRLCLKKGTTLKFLFCLLFITTSIIIVCICKCIHVCVHATHQRTHFGSWFSPSAIGSLQTWVFGLVQEASFPLNHLTRQNIYLCVGYTRTKFGSHSYLQLWGLGLGNKYTDGIFHL